MTPEKIKSYVEMLNWENPQEEQDEAICILSQIDERNFGLILDKSKKSTWENAVKVIKRIGFPQNESLLPGLLCLLQDVNWPGATEAIEILAEIDKKTVVPLIEQAIHSANLNEDFMWLGGLSLLVSKSGYLAEDFDDSCIFEILKNVEEEKQHAKEKNITDFNITHRERNILKLIADGYSNAQIANELVIAHNTVKNHVASIIKKLNVEDRVQIAVFALKNNLLE